MQSLDTDNQDLERQRETQPAVDGGRVDDLAVGSCKTIELSEGRELALYNVNGEFYATENFCPHKGAPLAAEHFANIQSNAIGTGGNSMYAPENA